MTLMSGIGAEAAPPWRRTLRARAKARPDRRAGHWLWAAGGLAVSFLFAVPLIAIGVLALQPAADSWSHLASTVLGRYVLHTLALMLGVGIGTLTIGAGTAWLVSMTRFPGSRWCDWLMILPLALPTYVAALVYTELLEFAGPVQGALRELFGWRLVSDYWFPDIRSLGGAIACLSLVLYPYVYLLARAAFATQSMRAIEAGRLLGLDAGRAFWSIALPMARPFLVVGVALALMETLNDFGAVQMFAVPTFTTGIYDVWLALNDRAGAAQLAISLLAFVLLLLWLERHGRRGQGASDRTRRFVVFSPRRLNGRAAIGASIACLLPILFGFAIPAITLIAWSARAIDWLRWQDFAADLTHSLSLAAGTAALAVVLALFLAYAARLGRRPWLRTLNGLVGVGYAIPGSVLAVGVLVPFGWFDNTVDAFARERFGAGTGLILSGTIVAVMFAYLVRFMAVSLGPIGSSLRRVTPNIEGAARTLGRGPGRTLIEVHMPMVRGGVLAAGLLVFVDVMKELPATLILRPFNFGTLATRVFDYVSEERIEEAAVWSLAIVLAGLVPVILLSRGLRAARPGGR